MLPPQTPTHPSSLVAGSFGSKGVEVSKESFLVHTATTGDTPALLDTLDVVPNVNTDCVTFKDSSFFKRHTTLPTIADVHRVALEQTAGHAINISVPPPVRFAALGVIVKYGPHVAIAEGECLREIRRNFGDQVPVPEVYGWRRDGGQVFIFMELIPAPTMDECWASLSLNDKSDVSVHLRTILSSLRGWRQNASSTLLGDLRGQPLRDVVLEGYDSGPFPSVKAFHDALTGYASSIYDPTGARPYDPHCDKLPNDAPIVFTHCDLHGGNILIRPATDRQQARVAAIIDWHQAGWYPGYWEYCKALWTYSSGNPDWADHYLPRVLDKSADCDYWRYFVLQRGM